MSRSSFSLLDRLIGTAPDPRSASAYATDPKETLKRMIRRDLQWLLGTRRTLQRPPPEGALTVTEYGLPDFAAVTPSDESALRRMEITIQDAIDAFEPRLQAVRVHVEASPTTPGQVHVSVEATLAVGEIREPVSFPFQVRTMD